MNPEASAAVRAGDPLRLERRGDVALVWLDRVTEGNLMDLAFMAAIRATLDHLDGWSGLRGVIWTAEGRRVFSLGAQTSLFVGLGAREAAVLSAELHATGLRLREHPLPHVACINGLALGGGLELALWCDLRVMAEHTSVGLPEVRLGIMPAWGGVENLGRAVGPAAALELALSGRQVRSDEALALGLVHRVVPLEGLVAAGLDLVQGIPRVPAAVRGIKASVDGDARRRLALEAEAFGACFEAPEAAEGIAAHREKRRASFL